MSWKKHFQAPSALQKYQQINKYSDDYSSVSQSNSYASRFQSWLPEVYQGQPNRIQRYSQYDNMDLDVEVSNALDIIADTCAMEDEPTSLPLVFEFQESISAEEVELLQEMLRQWISINEWDQRIWRLFRHTLKYGDQFFIRDPETYKLFWVDHSKVQSVIVNEGKGKIPEQYVITDLDLNLQTLVATGNLSPSADQRGYSTGPVASGQYGGQLNTTKQTGQGRFTAQGYGNNAGLAFYVDADHVVHVSLSEGLDNNWPFGQSILENVFKVFKQKELLEDAIIIYRVQRAPERRVFYVDTGRAPTHRAMAYLERVKNEIQQKRIPSRSGGGTNVIDATYNPMSMLEDYFFAQNADGKGSRVETLPGGDQLGQIDDLKYFHDRLRNGLKVPRSYMPSIDDGGGAIFNDGRIGSAYIEEFKFTRECMRLQNLIIGPLDMEFKLFCKHRGVNIHSSLFNINFVEPQNFSKYRQIELDSALLNVYSQVADIKHISRRFGLKRFLGLTEEEILENERLWGEENKRLIGKDVALGAEEDATGGGAGLGDVGASARGLDPDTDVDIDLDTGEADDLTGQESPISGAEQEAGTDPGGTEGN